MATTPEAEAGSSGCVRDRSDAAFSLRPSFRLRPYNIHVAFRVYLSHSVAPHELGAVYGIAELAAKKGMQPILSDRHWAPDEVPPARIVQGLTGINAFVVIATSSGSHLDWVNAELAEAIKLGLGREAVVSVVDPEIEPPRPGRVLTINRASLPETISKTAETLDHLHLEQSQKNLLAGLLLGGLAALLLASRE